MLALVNGMDDFKLPDLMDGKEYKGHTKNKGINLKMLLQALLFHYTPKSYHPLMLGEYTASISLPRASIH